MQNRTSQPSSTASTDATGTDATRSGVAATTTTTTATTTEGTGDQGKLWSYKQINLSPTLAPDAGLKARNILYSLRSTLSTVKGATSEDLKQASTFATQRMDVRFNALEMLKRDYADLGPSSKWTSTDLQARRQDLTEIEATRNAATIVTGDLTDTLALRYKEALNEFATFKADLDALKAATLLTDAPDQRVLAASDIADRAAQAAVDKQQQGKKDKAATDSQVRQQLDEAQQQQAQSNLLIQELRDELARSRQREISGVDPVTVAPPKPHAKGHPKGQTTGQTPASRRNNLR